MKDTIINMLLTQLQGRNPQAASQIRQAMNSGTNPQSLMKQMMGNSDNNQIQQVITQAKNLGVPDSVLSQVQNIK